MWGWFRPKCPLNLREKTWVELRLQWLIQRIGLEKVRAIEVLTPTDAHFPHEWTQSDADIRRIFDQVCGQMQVPLDCVELRIGGEARRTKRTVENDYLPLGLFQFRKPSEGRHCIWINRSQVTDPLQTISTISHELAHCILLGNEWINDADADHEFVTDLLMIPCGMGILAANAAVHEFADPLIDPSRAVESNFLYLPQRMLAYALAIFAWVREETAPPWSQHLRGDALRVFQGGLKYLRATHDSRCHGPVNSIDELQRPRPERLVDASPGVILATLWELRAAAPMEISAEDWSALATGLEHRERTIVAETARTIGALENADEHLVDRCLGKLRDAYGRPELQASLALALSGAQHHQAAAIDELTHLLEADEIAVVLAALAALRTFGLPAESQALKPVLQTLDRGLVRVDAVLLANTMVTLCSICDAPQRAIAEFFADDHELRNQAYSVLQAGWAEEWIFSPRLPTSSSLPVPVPNWVPPAVYPTDPLSGDASA